MECRILIPKETNLYAIFGATKVFCEVEDPDDMISSKNRTLLGRAVVGFAILILIMGTYLYTCQARIIKPDDNITFSLTEPDSIHDFEKNYVVLSYWIWQQGSLDCHFEDAVIRDVKSGEQIEESLAMVCEFSSIRASTPSVDFGSLEEIQNKYYNTLMPVGEYINRRQSQGASILLFIPPDKFVEPGRQLELELTYSVLGIIPKKLTYQIE